MRGPGQALNVDLHQTLRGKADHRAQKIRVGALLHKRARFIMSSVIVGSSVRVQCCNQTLPKTRDDHRCG
jgi:hypothetical protein